MSFLEMFPDLGHTRVSPIDWAWMTASLYRNGPQGRKLKRAQDYAAEVRQRKGWEVKRG